MRSSVAAAFWLNVFHRQAEKLVMCNIAQTVNVLHSMLLTDQGDRCIRTPAYWAFDLEKHHRSKSALRVSAQDTSPLGLSVSASRQGQDLVLTCVNPKHDAGMKVNCTLAGAAAVSGKAQILHDSDFNACNTLENPDRIVPREHGVSVAGSRVQLELPPLAIVTAQVRLA